jgi:hypothetical protein
MKLPRKSLATPPQHRGILHSVVERAHPRAPELRGPRVHPSHSSHSSHLPAPARPRFSASCCLPWLLAIVYLLSAISAPAAIVTNNVFLDTRGLPLTTKISFYPTNAVLLTSQGLSAGPAITTNITAGLLASSNGLSLAGGKYTVSFPLIPWRDPFSITVPDTTNTYHFTNLITNPNQLLIESSDVILFDP